jgi:hypothetical protein
MDLEMKVKHYVYARVITALLSTSAMATMALTDKDLPFESDNVPPLSSKISSLLRSEQLQEYKTAKLSLAPEIDDYDGQMASSLKAASISLDEAREEGPMIAGFTLSSVRQFGEIAALSYSGEENRRNIAAKYRAQGYQVNYFSTDAETSGMIMFKDKKVIVAYHGTESMRNVATDLWGNLVTSSFAYGRFHQGFYKGFQKTWDEVYSVIHTYARQHNYNMSELQMTFTGHSLGGALAGIGATRWAEMISADNVSVISFGAPKFCDTEAARRIEKLFSSRIVRITQHGYDVVPGVGPGIMGYTHVGLNLQVIAENWSDMHIMSAYNRLLAKLTPEEFIAKDTVRLIFRGGYYNPLNILDALTKGFNEMIIGNIHKAFTATKRATKRMFLGASKQIENAMEKSDKQADEAIKKQLIRHYEQNLKLFAQDQSSLKKENKDLEKKAKAGDVKAAELLELNKQVYAHMKHDIKALETALKNIKDADAHEVAHLVKEEAHQEAVALGAK